MRSTARVVIIGGGAVGAACLYHLAQAGVEECLLIEKDELTSGSTWHAAGNIPTYATSWLGMRAGNYAWRLYKDLAAAVDSPITYRHTGAFWPAHTQDRMDLFRHLVGVSRSAGFELAMLSPQEMEAMHPYYRAGDSVIGGIHDPYEGDIDPSQLTQALARGARAGGAEISRFTRVTAIERNTDNEWVVTTDKGTVRCEIIVNATGFYGNQVGQMVGQPLPLATLEHNVLNALNAPTQALLGRPLIGDGAAGAPGTGQAGDGDFREVFGDGVGRGLGRQQEDAGGVVGEVDRGAVDRGGAAVEGEGAGADRGPIAVGDELGEDVTAVDGEFAGADACGPGGGEAEGAAGDGERAGGAQLEVGRGAGIAARGAAGDDEVAADVGAGVDRVGRERGAGIGIGPVGLEVEVGAAGGGVPVPGGFGAGDGGEQQCGRGQVGDGFAHLRSCCDSVGMEGALRILATVPG